MDAIKKIMFYLMLAVVLFSFMAPTSAYAKAYVFMDNHVELIDMIVFIECANEGMGEWVLLSGDLQIKDQFVIDTAAGVHASIMFNPHGIKGIGMDTGDMYQGTGLTREQINEDFFTSFPLEYTFINNFRIIGQGPGNNLLVHETWHVTINEDGEIITEVINSSYECK